MTSTGAPAQGDTPRLRRPKAHSGPLRKARSDPLRHGWRGLRLALLVALLLAALSAAGCLDEAPPATPPPQPAPSYAWGDVTGQTLTLWGNVNDVKRPFLQKAFARYEELTGNRLEVVPYTHQELERRLQDAFASGTGPDVFLFPGGYPLEALDPHANFYDFTTAPWVDDLTDTALTQTIRGGRVVGLPHWEASIAGILYNRDLFRKLGISLPRTQAEFLAACEKLKQNGIIPLYLPFAEPTMLLYQFPLDSLVQATTVLDDLNSGRLGYSDLPEMAAIVSWYKTMAERGYLGPDYEHNGWDGMDEALKSGRYAMMLCWDTWLYTDFTGDPARFGLMPAFVGTPDEGTFEGPNLMLLIVNKNGPQREAALDFITFLADPYNYNAAFEGMHTAPVFRKQVGSLTTPQYDANPRLIERLLRDSTARPLIQGFGQIDATFIQRHMQDASYTVEECLRDMEAARQARLQKGRASPTQEGGAS